MVLGRLVFVLTTYRCVHGGCMRKKKTSQYEGKFKAGHTFGFWTVVDGIIHGSPATMDLVCSCGTKKRVDVYTLISGKSKSCGCRRKLTGESSPRWKGQGSLDSSVLRRALKKASLVPGSTITDSDLSYSFSEQGGTCAVTGQPLMNGTIVSANVVRIDNSLPYTPNNTAWVSPMVSTYVSRTGITGVNSNIFEQLGMKKEE